MEEIDSLETEYDGAVYARKSTARFLNKLERQAREMGLAA